MGQVNYRIQAHRKALRQRSQVYGQITRQLPALPETEDQYQKGWSDCRSAITAYLKHEEETAPSWPALAATIFRLNIDRFTPGRQP